MTTGMKEVMVDIFALDLYHLGQAPSFHSSIGSQHLPVAIEQANKLGQRVDCGFPFLFGLLNLSQNMFKGFGRKVSVQVGLMRLHNIYSLGYLSLNSSLANVEAFGKRPTEGVVGF